MTDQQTEQQTEAPASTPPAFVPCGRCGGLIRVDDEEVKRVLKAQPIEMFHDNCSTVPGAPARQFRVTVEVFEVFHDENPADPDADLVERAESITRVVGEAEGQSFMGAFPDLEKRLGVLWQRIRDHGGVIDSLAASGEGDAPRAPQDVERAVLGGPSARALIVPR